jgi:ABC-type sugar transport system ATPase subunit
MADIVMEAKNVYKTYGKKSKKASVKQVEAVKNVSLQIRKGDIKLIFGPSGSGKSTFLRCMAMLDIPDKGEIYLGEECLTKPGVESDLSSNTSTSSATLRLWETWSWHFGEC